MSIIEARLGGTVGLQARAFHPRIEGARPAQRRPGREARQAERLRLRGLAAMLAVDAAASLAAPGAALLLAKGAPPMPAILIRAVLFLATLMLMALGGAYRLRIARAPLAHAGHLLGVLAGAHLLMLGQLWLAQPAHPPGLPWAAAGYAAAAAFTIAGRLILAAWWRARPGSPRGRAVLIAPTPCGQALAQKLNTLTGHAIGYALCWDEKRWGGEKGIPWRSIDGLATLEAMIADGAVNEILLLHRREPDPATQARVTALLARLADKPVRVRLAVDLAAEMDAFGFTSGTAMRLIPLLDLPLSNGARLYKRALDLVIGGLAVAVTAPLMGLIALALRRSGPVLFRQRRIGANGRKFTVLKFRTMVPAGQAPRAPLVQARRGDPRVTKLGAWLRRTSLDELPQLFNVLRGEMSLVGPRPHAPGTCVGAQSFEQMIDLYGVRHRLKPGMTGLAQIRGQRGGTEHPEALAARVASDFEYVESWSPGLDLAILLRTIPQVFTGHNAY